MRHLRLFRESTPIALQQLLQTRLGIFNGLVFGSSRSFGRLARLLIFHPGVVFFELGTERPTRRPGFNFDIL